MGAQGVDGGTVGRVLERLGIPAAPPPTPEGLAEVYGRWCRAVPFDNVQKRISLVEGAPAPFPNGDPEVFFAEWLRHGTGGTCWPGTLALHALLLALGFDARLGSAAMMDDLVGPVHTHGTVIVRAGGGEWLADTSMLTDRPVPLVRREATALDHPVRPVRVQPVDDLWRIWWQSNPMPEPIGCLLLDDDVTVEHCRARYEVSREMSPFNAKLVSNVNRDGGSLSLVGDVRFERDTEGLRSGPVPGGREQVMVEEFGYSAEIAARLPADD